MLTQIGDKLKFLMWKSLYAFCQKSSGGVNDGEPVHFISVTHLGWKRVSPLIDFHQKV